MFFENLLYLAEATLQFVHGCDLMFFENLLYWPPVRSPRGAVVI